MSSGYWPGYIAAGSKPYKFNFAYKNIVFASTNNAGYDYKFNLAYLYDQIRNAEADGGRVDDTSGYNEDSAYSGESFLRYKPGIGTYKPRAEKDGLYLVSAIEKNDGYFGSIYDASGNTKDIGNHYHYALYLATQNTSSFDEDQRYVFLGSSSNQESVWIVTNNNGQLSRGLTQKDYKCIIAPAFNLDISKINLTYKNGLPYITPKTQSAIRIGEEYTMGTYKDHNGNIQPIKWICAERLDDNVYAMQSEGIAGGQWPGYIYYRGYTSNNFLYKNISELNTSNYYDSKGNLKAFYDKYGGVNHVEASGGRNESSGKWEGKSAQNNGLYLIDSIYNREYGEYYYGKALKEAANAYSFFELGKGEAWLGTNTGSETAACIHYYDGSISDGSQDRRFVLAPAFNIDATKVNVNDGDIKQKGS